MDNMFICEAAPIPAVTAAQTYTCTSCSDDAIGTVFCADCAEWLCDACLQAHKRVKVTKDHVIRTKEEFEEADGSGKLVTKSINCTIHPKEKLHLYCVTCEQLTCRDCQLIEHRDHRYKFAEEMASQTRERLRRHLRDIQVKRSYIESAKDLVGKRRRQIIKKQDSVRTDINRLVDTFVEIIRNRGSALILLLSEVCSNKQEQLDKKQEVLQHLGGQADHCTQVLNAVLDSSSDTALLYSKK